MKQKIQSIATVIMLLFLGLTVKAQMETVNASSGGYFEGKNLSLSFTIGEMVTQTLSAPGIMLTQGFQQPRLSVSTISQQKNLAINIQAYPNPVTEYLSLVTSELLLPGSSCQVFNSSGILVSEKKLEGTTTRIEFSSMSSSTYFLKVVQNSKTLKTFKIIKN